MLHDLGWQSFDGRRQDQRLVLFYKIINRLASVETEDMLTPADSRTRNNHSFKFKHLQANCDSYRFSFFPATISSWNNLPFGIEKVDSVEARAYLRGGGSNPPQNFQIFLKSEGKEIKRKRKKRMLGGGGYFLTYFWG